MPVPPTLSDAVTVVVLNWKGWRDTIPCLESLLGSAHGNLRLLVCDNASPDDSVARIRAWSAERLPTLGAARGGEHRAPPALREVAHDPGTGRFTEAGETLAGDVVLIHTGENRGYAAGNNVGLRYALANAPCDFAFVLNNDTEVDADAIPRLLARMHEDPTIGLCGATVCYHGEPGIVQNLAGCTFTPWKGRASPIGMGRRADAPIDAAAVEARLAYVSGAATFVRRAFLEEVGLMEEDYFLYGEEHDWALRAKGRYRLGYAPGALVYHKVGASIGTSDGSEGSSLSEYYLTRNRVRVCWRHMRPLLPIVMADIARDIWRRVRSGRRDRAVLMARAALGLPR